MGFCKGVQDKRLRRRFGEVRHDLFAIDCCDPVHLPGPKGIEIRRRLIAGTDDCRAGALSHTHKSARGSADA